MQKEILNLNGNIPGNLTVKLNKTDKSSKINGFNQNAVKQ